MWTIRTEQIGDLTDPVRRKADLGMADYARKRFPAVFKNSSSDELRALVERVRTQARKFGIYREDNVATFLDFSVMYGEDFQEARWASGILKSVALHGPDKVAILKHRVRSTGTKL